MCEDFFANYSTNGSAFPCHPSRLDPSLILTRLNMTEVHQNLVYSLGVPIPCLVISVIYMSVAYNCFYHKKSKKPEVRVPCMHVLCFVPLLRYDTLTPLRITGGQLMFLPI